MKIIEQIRTLLSPPPALVIAARKLEEHKRLLLEAKADHCWADKRVKFHSEQVADLVKYLEGGRDER